MLLSLPCSPTRDICISLAHETETGLVARTVYILEAPLLCYWTGASPKPALIQFATACAVKRSSQA